MTDLEFYNKQDKEELVSMCMVRDNKINSLKHILLGENENE